MRARGGARQERAPGERLYRRLLRLYPAVFRDRFGEEMAGFYRERWQEARSRGRGAAAAAWLRSTVDLVATALVERMDARRRPREVVHTTVHDEREGEMLGSVGQDVRYALRGMRRSTGFAAIVVATLALGIGANTAIFTVVNGILLRPLPFREPARIVEVSHMEPYLSVSEPEFMDYRRDSRSFEHLAACAPSNASLTGTEEPERAPAARVSDGFFTVLGVAPAIGRTFTADEDAFGGPPVVMISDGLWRRRFGGDRGIVGRTIRVNGTERTVVGVMPARFGYPTATTAVWVPLGLNPDSLWTRNNHYLSLVGRLAPGATPTRAMAELNTMGRRWLIEYPDIYFPGKPLATKIVPMREALVGATRPYLLALAGAVGFVLLIACVNVANLLLARGESRRKELAIRTALGASGRRLARQALTESAILGVAGGVLGLLLAWLGVRALLAIAPTSIPRLDEVRIDVGVLAFALGVSIATGLLFGLAPALRAARGVSAETLKQGGKTSGHVGGTRRTRHALVVAEVALAVVMLSGAGLMLRSLTRLQAMDLGFDPSGLLTMQLSLPRQEYGEERAVEYFRELTERVAALPGVRSAAASWWLPMDATGGGGSSWSIQVDGRVVASISEAPTATPAQVTPDYFAAMHIPIVRGRGFTEADRGDAPLVLVVNETMARQLWPGQDPIGHTVRMFGMDDPWATVVGVVGDVRSSGFLAPVPPTMYHPHAQAGRGASFTSRSMTLVVRTTGDPLALAAAARGAARALDRNVPISTVQSMEQLVAASIAGRRFTTTLLGAFAALALALAGIGIYGVIAYGVSQRTYELGVRMALGAQRGNVLRLVVSEGLRMTLLGLAIGLAGALLVGRLVRSLLVGVPAADLPTLAAVAGALAGVALVASLVPARRASLVSPTEALRDS